MSVVQNFKGDAPEIKMRAVAEPAFDLTDSPLNQFYAEGDTSDAWYLALYDEGRMPFSERIERQVFTSFIRQTLENYPFIGTFESYLFILREIFGDESIISFEVPAAGKLSININAIADIVFDAVVRELTDTGEFEFSTLATMGGDDIVFRGIAGIETDYELTLLFSEIRPAGIFPTLSLEFFSLSTFIGEDGDGIFDVVAKNSDNLVFYEVGE